MKKLLGALVCLSLIAAFIAACTGPMNNATGPNPVHMNDVSFEQPSITIKKGEEVTLINDALQIHVIANGTWDDSTPRPKIEPGAPKTNIQVNGDGTGTIGPFNTIGTFNIYCTVHPNMKMSIIVK
jgi:plastocyanin